VTVIIDLTPTRDGTGASRLLDMFEGRSKQVFRWPLDPDGSPGNVGSILDDSRCASTQLRRFSRGGDGLP